LLKYELGLKPIFHIIGFGRLGMDVGRVSLELQVVSGKIVGDCPLHLCNQVVGSVTVRVDIVVADGDLEGLGQDEIRCSPRELTAILALNV